MIEPLSIEAAKDKAAQELGFPVKYLMPTKEGFVSKPTRLTEVIDRAMELHTASHLKAKTAGQTESHPCKLCGEMTEPLAGDPSKWPVYLPYLAESGKGNFFHSGCISDILRTADEAVKAKMQETE